MAGTLRRAAWTRRLHGRLDHRLLRHLGLEAGRDFSLIGCDDVREAAQWYPALTTVKNFQDEMGRKAAEFLIRRIAEPQAPIATLRLTPELVLRGTTAAPR